MEKGDGDSGRRMQRAEGSWWLVRLGLVRGDGSSMSGFGWMTDRQGDDQGKQAGKA